MIDGLKPYSAYKDSGVLWLGPMPAHWAVASSKRLFSARQELARPDDVQLSATQAYGVIPQSEFEAKVGRRVVKITMHLEKRRHVEKDDFVISMRSFQGGLERASAAGCIRSSYVVLKPGRSVEVGYYSYLFKSSDYIRALQSMAGFIRDGQDLNFSNFSSVALPDVPQEDQRLIGRFLTYADRRIRRLVSAKQRLVKLLAEQRQAIINSVVTRGLDPNAPLKQSGVDWLGDVPAHWVTYRLKAILHPVDVRSTTGNETLLSLRREHGIVPYAEHFERPHQAASLTGFKLVEVGQLVLNRLQANNGLIFFAGLRGLVSPDYSVFAPHGQAALGYLEVVLRTHRYRGHFRRESTGLGTGSSGFLRLYDDRFLNTQVCLPSRPEQDDILRAIARQTSVIDGLIDRERRLLTTIVDYRARLISDVVTGKLDVREGAARLPEEPTTGWEDEPEVLEGEEPDADESDLAEVSV